VLEVILLDELVTEHNDRFLENAYLYPAKVPQHFMGCPIKVGTVGIDPFVIMTENYTQNDGSTAYRLTGLSVDVLQLVCQKKNLTTAFLPPLLNLDLDSYLNTFTELEEGLSDVVKGMAPLLPVVVTSSFDDTIPYKYANMKKFLPCPKAIPGTGKIMTTFSLSVWLTVSLVLLLLNRVEFWCADNVPYRSVCNVTHKRHSPTVSTMLGLCLWQCQFHSSPQIRASEFPFSVRLFLFR
jgi:hypothetical protein